MKKEQEMQDTLVGYVKALKEQGISNKRIKKAIGDYLENKARERFIPISGSFELTPLCNLDCKMCYVHLANNVFSQYDLLPVDTWKALIEQACEAGMNEATLTGGECLTYPGFDDLFLLLYEKRIKTHVLSNGLLIDEKRIDFFKKYPPCDIKITLYGSCDDAYEKVTNRRAFNLVYHNICMIRDAGLPIFISITPSSFMQDDMLPLIEKAESLGIPYEINARLFPARKNTGREVKDLTIQQYIELYRIRADFKRKKLFPNDPNELPLENREGPECKGTRCGAGRSSFAIKYDGKMCPCLALDELTAPTLEIGFNKAWKMTNDMAINYRVPGECVGCVYSPVCIHCVAMHKNAPDNGHCDPKICERTKRLAQEGFFKYYKEKV